MRKYNARIRIREIVFAKVANSPNGASVPGDADALLVLRWPIQQGIIDLNIEIASDREIELYPCGAAATLGHLDAAVDLFPS